MPKRHIRFQNKQGDWKTRKQGFIGSRLGVKLTKSQRRMLRANKSFVSHKGNARGNFTPDSISGHQKTKQFGKKQSFERIHEVAVDDSEAGIIHISEAEESSRYTPSRTVDVYQHDNGGKVQIIKINPRDERIVSRTEINVTPSIEKSTKAYDLQERYKAGEKLEVRRGLVPLADSLGIKTGAPTEKRLKREINKKLGITETQRIRHKLALKETMKETKSASNEPQAPNRNIKTVSQGGRKATNDEINYYNKARTATINETKLTKFKKDLTEIIHKREKAKDPLPSLARVRPRLKEKGYSRFEQDKYLFALEKRSVIDLQIASDQKLVSDFGSAIPTAQRGLIYYVNLRR